MAAVRRSDSPALEKQLYAPVESFVRSRFGCFATAVNVGLSHGRIDVVGIRDVGGDLTGSDEVIAVEVKRGTQPFTTCAGQTAGYSVFAEQCYLAEFRPSAGFSADEEAIARHLGIGLIRIKSTSRMEVVLTAPQRIPIDRLRTALCDNLGQVRCVACGNLFARGDGAKSWSNVARQGSDSHKALDRAAKNELGYAYWLYDSEERQGRSDRDRTYRRRYVCPDCVAALFPRRPAN